MVLPVVIFVAVIIPLMVVAVVVTTRRKASGERTGGPVDEATQEEYEREFEAAEAYQEKWREEQHRQHPDDSIY